MDIMNYGWILGFPSERPWCERENVHFEKTLLLDLVSIRFFLV